MTEDVVIHKQRVKPFLRQLLAVSGVVMYMIGTGANIAFPAVLLEQLREPDSAIHLTEEEESWIASILGLALIVGILSSPFSLQRFGRRLHNQLSTLPSLAGWVLMATVKNPELLLASRFLQGFGMGLQAPASSVSIAEYSAPKHRGAFLATIAFSFATGMLLAHVLGSLLYWRTASFACGSVYAISLVLISMSPETPPYLASRGKFNQCRKAFRWLRGHDSEAEKELAILINSQKIKVQTLTPNNSSKLKHYCDIVKKPEFYKPTVIMIFMFLLFQLSGMTVIPSYTVAIMDEVTDGAIESYLSMFVVDTVRFLTAILACVVVNRYNRRAVLFTGIIVSVISLLLTSLLLFIRELEYLPKNCRWIPVIPTLTYIFGKTLGILPIPWAVAGEIFPLAYRSIGSGISGMILSIMFFVVVKTAPLLMKTFHLSGTFCFYGVSVAICGVCLYFMMPETKGKTLYEIECHFRRELDILSKENEGEKDNMLEMQIVEGG